MMILSCVNIELDNDDQYTKAKIVKVLKVVSRWKGAVDLHGSNEQKVQAQSMLTNLEGLLQNVGALKREPKAKVQKISQSKHYL